MAYSNYGALVWKNGKEITKELADTSFYWNKKKWESAEQDIEKIMPENYEKYSRGGHVNIVCDNCLVVFYKTYVDFYIGKKNDNYVKHIHINPENKIFKSLDGYKFNHIKIDGFMLNDFIQSYDLYFKGDHYFIIIGGCIGNGWDERHTTKFLRKVRYRAKDDEYILPIFENSWALDYYLRKDDREDVKKDLWQYGVKPMLKFHWFNRYYWERISEELKNLHYLR